MEFAIEAAFFLGGPVEVAFGLATLHQIGDHDDSGGADLPNHAPEVVDGILVGSLGRDVLALFFITVDVGTVNVVTRVLLVRI